MSIPAARLASLAVVLTAGLLLGSTRAGAQARVAARADAPDSVAWVVRRQPLQPAGAALRTRDRHAALLLTDTAVVLQLTDRGLEHVTTQLGDAEQGVGGRLLGRVLAAGITGLLDHGLAYRLSALRGARVEGGQLVLEDLDGQRVFAGTELNGRRVMDDFAPAEAERFAATLNRAIRALR